MTRTWRQPAIRIETRIGEGCEQDRVRSGNWGIASRRDSHNAPLALIVLGLLNGRLAGTKLTEKHRDIDGFVQVVIVPIIGDCNSARSRPIRA